MDNLNLLIYRPQKDDRLSWPGWLTYSGWFTHISGHPLAIGRAQYRKSSPVKDLHSTTVLRTEQGHCGACRMKWRLTDTDLCYLSQDPDDVSHCQILSPDKTEWRLIPATLCGWRRCFVADQLWLMTRIREEAIHSAIFALLLVFSHTYAHTCFILWIIIMIKILIIRLEIICNKMWLCRYSFEGVLQAIYGYDREPFECEKDGKRACIFQEGDDVLKELDVEHANFYVDFIALCSFFVVLRVACYLVLRWRVKMHWSTSGNLLWQNSCLLGYKYHRRCLSDQILYLPKK